MGDCRELEKELDKAKKEIKRLKKLVSRATDTATNLADQADTNLQQGRMGRGAWGHYQGQLESAEKILTALEQPRRGAFRIGFVRFRGFNR